MKKFFILAIFICGVLSAQEGVWFVMGFDSYVNKFKMSNESTLVDQRVTTTMPYIGLIWNTKHLSLRIKGGITKTSIPQANVRNNPNNMGQYWGIEVRFKLEKRKKKRNT